MNHRLASSLCLIGLMAGCGASRPGEVMERRSVEGLDENHETYMERANALLQRAHEGMALKEAIDNLEKANAVRPGQRDTLYALTIQYYRYAYSFGAAQSEAEQMELYLRGKNYGWEALLLIPEFKAAMEAGREIDAETVKLIPVEAVPEMFLMTSNWARWGELKGILTQAFDIPKIKALVDRALELDENFYNAGPHRFLGAYFTEIPSFAGRDVEKSREHFERSMELAPDCLENRFMYAKYYAKAADDEALYRDTLQKILNHPIDPADPYRLEQETAQRMAKDWLEKAEDIF